MSLRRTASASGFRESPISPNNCLTPSSCRTSTANPQRFGSLPFLQLMAIAPLGSRKNPECMREGQCTRTRVSASGNTPMRADARCSIVAKDFLRNQRNRAVRLRAQDKDGLHAAHQPLQQQLQSSKRRPRASLTRTDPRRCSSARGPASTTCRMGKMSSSPRVPISPASAECRSSSPGGCAA